MKRLPVALQLYTLRDQLKDDFRGVVHKVAEIGYDGAQFAGYGGLSASEMRQLLKDTGLQPVGTHTGLNVLEGQLDQEIDYNLEIGNKWIICPSLPEARRQDVDGWREIAVSWTQKGGEAPANMIRQYAGRVPITHLKDETKDDRKTFAEVGEGSLDWPAILQASDESEVEWHCVEQDRCDRDPLESVAISMRNLKKWG